MIARRRRLRHRHGPVGVEPREQHRGLHLSRGHGRLVGERLGLGQSPNTEWQAIAVAAADDRRAHAGERVGDALHRPPSQRVVAGEERPERLTGEHAEEQAHGRARVAAVDDVGRLGEAAPPDTGDAVLPRTLPRHLGAQRFHGGDRAQAVLGLEIAADVGGALCERAQQRRPVRDGLVARNLDAP